MNKTVLIVQQGEEVTTIPSDKTILIWNSDKPLPELHERLEFLFCNKLKVIPTIPDSVRVLIADNVLEITTLPTSLTHLSLRNIVKHVPFPKDLSVLVIGNRAICHELSSYVLRELYSDTKLMRKSGQFRKHITGSRSMNNSRRTIREYQNRNRHLYSSRILTEALQQTSAKPVIAISRSMSKYGYVFSDMINSTEESTKTLLENHEL